MKAIPILAISLSAAFGLTGLSTAQAATVSKSFSGNDCSGYFGRGFDSCTIFVEHEGENIDLAHVVAKFNGGLSLSEANDELFPNITGDEFSFSDDVAENKTGTWTYTAGTDDPGIRYWTAKAGNGFTLFWDVADSALDTGGVCDVDDVYTFACLDAAQFLTSNSWATPRNKELSHITFYGTTAVPVPAAIWLLGSALGGLGFMRRRSK